MRSGPSDLMEADVQKATAMINAVLLCSSAAGFGDAILPIVSLPHTLPPRAPRCHWRMGQLT